MRNAITAALLLVLGSTAAHASAVRNPIFGHTHMLASPFTLPAGRVTFGSTAAIGVTDFFDLSTNVVRDIFQIFNLTARFSLVDTEKFAFGVFVGSQAFNFRSMDSANPDLWQTSVLPGAVAGVEILPRLALMVGGNLTFTNPAPTSSGVTTHIAYLQGAQVESDLSWAYAPSARSLGNVISVGATYDFTYGIYGIGLSHHFPGLHVGLHYYPRSPGYQVYPIISGGASFQL